MCQLEEYVQLLLSFSRGKEFHNESEFEGMVNKLTALHKEYYTTKWAAAHQDVCVFFSPIWLSPFEKALLWITGWKPSSVFRVFDSLRKSQLLVDISEEQLKKIDGLKAKISLDEEKVEREMERQQVAVANRRMVELAGLASRIRRSSGGNSGGPGAAQIDALVEVAIKGMISGLERVMKMGDCVRLKTLKGLLDLLNPIQSVDLLAAFSMVQIQMRKWGKKKDMINQLCSQIS